MEKSELNPIHGSDLHLADPGDSSELFLHLVHARILVHEEADYKRLHAEPYVLLPGF